MKREWRDEIGTGHDWEIPMHPAWGIFLVIGIFVLVLACAARM